MAQTVAKAHNLASPLLHYTPYDTYPAKAFSSRFDMGGPAGKYSQEPTSNDDGFDTSKRFSDVFNYRLVWLFYVNRYRLSLVKNTLMNVTPSCPARW